jgi:methylmalonyl-CoA/ethylmalonyl-CoA epimerase
MSEPLTDWGQSGVVRRLGKVMQIAFVSRDLRSDAALWSRQFGVGPFFELAHIPLIGTLYRGNPSSVDISAAVAYWGDLQIELIQQFDDAPSVYREGCSSRAMGIHHLGVLVDDYETACAHMMTLDATPITETAIPDAVRATYFQVPGQRPFIEILEVQPAFRQSWDAMKSAASNWSGEAPYRTES